MKSSEYYIDPDEAVKEQHKLRKKIRIEPLRKKVRTVAGADISFNRSSDVLYAGFVILQLPDMNVLGRSLARKEVNFPYIPGLLAFREIPALMKAWNQLPEKPDVVIVDGHGIAHPRGMGIATHFGVITDQPTIGCAKNVLSGSYNEPEMEQGTYTAFTDDGDKIGMVYRTRENVKPVYISPGHRVSFKDTIDVIGKCLTGYKLPETTRKAHDAVNAFRKGELQAGYWENPELGLFA